MKARIAIRIRTIRLTKGYSQQNMADELNISPSAYSNIERGIADMNLTRLNEIANVLGVGVTDLFNTDQQVNDVSPEPYSSPIGQQVHIIMQQIQLFQQQISSIQREITQLKSKL